ncbi:TIR domain-containing protein [Pantanalinema sp. GBBB05]|uniref:TIR domain-containing protein n=1 Tax=Pantanalinema sp. GBBB05 TaxID=2604139 RepID=UPI001D416ED2|nr:TIR domain-containing protein [Pantanalinema sp. GBBB05]
MNQFQDAFISYGRADSKAFAQKLNNCLVQQGLEIWFDFDDIPLGVDYQKQIDDGIDKSDNFLFVIAPHSVNSPYCRLEVELALRRHKRIIPILHVEQIDRNIWQQRLPNGTDDEWQIYREKGLHSSFPNMHPEIAKINWVYCREGIDDFQQALASLITLMERDRPYVRQHTYFLAKALEWDRQHRETPLLLVGEERHQAEDWLRYRFQETQPPCVPTALHCEYITESTKNANNLMTQVFLSWSTQDREVMEQIRHSLMRENITVWVSKTDIKTGADFQQVINRGIEEADNIVYLISPDSLESKYCQQEIDYALSLNKRIIPLLMRVTDLEQIPEQLRNLQFINFADNTTQEQYDRDIAKLIKILHHDADYYAESKMLLCKALKWERQHQNPCILLRGYNLRHAEAWLKVGRHRDQHRPIALIEQFIEESLRQPAGVALDVFVSYSRKDADFARRLNDALQIQGKTTWFDQESIAAGSADFQQEIYRGIESANHFLFVISPSAIASPYCSGEVEYAVKLNKRIITVLAHPTDPSTLPPELASVQWIDFSQSKNNFDANFSVLLRTLDTDPDYLKTHTWLLLRSLEWEHKGRDEGLLLRGKVLDETCDWLLEGTNKKPEPTRLQRDFVTASNESESKRQRATVRLQRVGLALVSGISLVAIGLGLTAFKQYQEATQLQRKANQEEILAQTKTSDSMFQSGRSFEALLEAMQTGIKLKRYQMVNTDLQPSVLTALQQAVFWVQENQRLGSHGGIIWSVSVSPDGQRIASASADGSVKLWKRDGTLVQKIASTNQEPVLAVAFSPDGQFLIMGGANQQGATGQATLVRLSDMKQIALGKQTAPVVGVAASPDGTTIATASEDSLVRLWNRDGKYLRTLDGHNAPVRSVTFSPDGQTIATASDDRTIRLWQRDGTPLKTLVGHTAQVRSVNYSPDGKLLVSASWDETVRLWKSDGTPLRTIEGHNTLVHDARFSPDGKLIASAGWDKSIRLWTLAGTLVSILPGHTAQIRTLSFSPTDGVLVSAGGDRLVRLWTLNRPLLATLQDHWARVYSVTFSAQGVLASSGADNTVRLWTQQGSPLRVLKGHQSVVWATSFSPDGKTLVSASSDHTIKLWNTETGQLLQTLVGHAGPVYSVKYSPDGQLLASTGADQTVRLWRRDGTAIRTLQDFKRGLLSVAISPDDRLLAVAGWDNTVKLLTLTGKPVAEFKGHQGWVYHVTFSPDGQRLLTASYDGTAKLWTLNGQLITTLQGHEDGVVAADFSADGRWLATASHDNTVKLWTSDGKLITTLRGHRDRVSDVTFSHDGTLLATASEDKTVLLWELKIQGDLDKLLARGCQWTKDFLHSNPTDFAEVRQYCQTTSVPANTTTALGQK